MKSNSRSFDAKQIGLLEGIGLFTFGRSIDVLRIGNNEGHSLELTVSERVRVIRYRSQRLHSDLCLIGNKGLTGSSRTPERKRTNETMHSSPTCVVFLMDGFWVRAE
jgi:hypothetical protein